MELDKQPKATRDLIFGTWYLDLEETAKGYLVLQKGDLLLQREPAWPLPPDMRGAGEIRGWGQGFAFRDSGEFVESYGAECGLDPQVHGWSGTWIWDDEEQSLFLRIMTYPTPDGFYVEPSEDYRNGLKFYVTELPGKGMQLRPANPAAQLWREASK